MTGALLVLMVAVPFLAVSGWMVLHRARPRREWVARVWVSGGMLIAAAAACLLDRLGGEVAGVLILAGMLVILRGYRMGHASVDEVGAG
ncbi:hypothetical protein [Longimicrobium terrae]|uniref:Steroid 5-alpha reductase family enzyme n=1 Tax=Longimicrobium terrae TaxID=1639882 RepID=A0A841GYU7_9BACT|nr:hypothetical protein [Longimicrobium terrae]MBB4636553.1 steroid 5-alpha reductase family enzyme [Longimicrobium terrae]MBB6070923.1 steroid 5-alpha reductase family enzyme [Longimicrobium terrae]NNC28945.1 hypothetical protein [Longimicrobium terrae]